MTRREGGGVLVQYLDIGEPLRDWNPDPGKDKKFPKIYTLFRTKEKMHAVLFQ